MLNYSELSALIYPVGELFDFNDLKLVWKMNICIYVQMNIFINIGPLFYYFHNYFKTFFINYI